jgi:MFS family permease
VPREPASGDEEADGAMSTDRTARARSVALVILCQIAAMTLWFSASAAVPSLVAQGGMSPHRASLLTGAVQLGFVFGTLASALSGLADRFDSRRLFAACAATGACANALLLATGFDRPEALALRFVTGVCMAGVYPVGMKLAAGWAAGNMGLMIGALVGALTLGSALPHLFTAWGGVQWQVAVAFSSACAAIAAAAIGFVRLGPNHGTYPRFRLADVAILLRQRSLLLAQGGYLGHMWELYAMWAWMASFLAWALPASGAPDEGMLADPSAVTFLVVAAGALGCVVAGRLADRFGRTLVTTVAMASSGACAVSIGFAVQAGPAWLIAVAVLWGVTVIADSAQFSAAIAELSDPRYVGTLLTLQTCLGFLLTIGTIQLVPAMADAIGWRHAFAVLAIGPALGAASMWVLRGHPDAVRMAGGRR